MKKRRKPGVKYEPCDWCTAARAENDYKRALGCPVCNGSGYVPSIGETPCNGCGGSMADGTREHDRQAVAGIFQHVLHGAYGSPALTDLVTYTFSMCEHCLRAWFASCKVPPKTERYDLVGVRPNEPISYAEDHELYENRKWRENLGAANARLHGICNQTRDCGKPAKWTLSLSGEITDHCLCDDHRSTWDNCTNASIVPFVPDELWTRGREVTVSPARRAGWTEPGAPGRLDGDAYRIDGSFPDRVADGVLAVLCDTTIVRVRASLSELYQRPVTEFLRVMLTRNGILSESPLPDLTLKTAGFRKRDSQLGFWLQGALFQAIGQNKGIEIVVVGEWMNGKDQDDDQVEINPSP